MTARTHYSLSKLTKACKVFRKHAPKEETVTLFIWDRNFIRNVVMTTEMRMLSNILCPVHQQRHVAQRKSLLTTKETGYCAVSQQHSTAERAIQVKCLQSELLNVNEVSFISVLKGATDGDNLSKAAFNQ